MGEDYAEHIRNKALLSYDSRWNAEELAEYLAEEILRKERLEWLKTVIEETVARLNETEKALLAIRYFGRRRKKKETPFSGKPNVGGLNPKTWSERKYFRFQQRLSEKVSGMLIAAGVTKSLFENELIEIELIQKVHRFVERDRTREERLPKRKTAIGTGQV